MTARLWPLPVNRGLIQEKWVRAAALGTQMAAAGRSHPPMRGRFPPHCLNRRFGLLILDIVLHFPYFSEGITIPFIIIRLAKKNTISGGMLTSAVAAMT